MKLYRIFTLCAIALLAFTTSSFAQQTYRGAIIETGQPILVSVPFVTAPAEQPQSIVVHDTFYKGSGGKGGSSQGNTTISGSLTVTGTVFCGTGASTPTWHYGPNMNSYSAPAANTAVTITADVTDVLDAGGDVTITLPTAANGRVLYIYNESATYNVTDGGLVTIAPNSGLTLHAVGGSWK